MTENTRIMLHLFARDTLKDIEGAIRNEQLWEKGYSGEEPNPHTENIAKIKEYEAEIRLRFADVL